MFHSPEDFANAAFSSLEMQRDDFETQMCVMKCGEIFWQLLPSTPHHQTSDRVHGSSPHQSKARIAPRN
jgi:hypothetical protein